MTPLNDLSDGLHPAASSSSTTGAVDKLIASSRGKNTVLSFCFKSAPAAIASLTAIEDRETELVSARRKERDTMGATGAGQAEQKHADAHHVLHVPAAS